MNNIIIPDLNRLPFPADIEFLKVMQIIFFILHIIPMNLLVGGCLVILFSELFYKNETNHKILIKDIVNILPVVVAYAVLFGVATLLFTQVVYGQFFYTSSVIIAVPWISVIVLLIIGYYSLYLRNLAYDKLTKVNTIIAFVITSVFLIIMFIYTSNITLMLNPYKWTKMYFNNPYGLNIYVKDSTIIPKYLHFLLSSIAVSGLFIVWYGVLTKKDELYRKWVINYGILLFVIPSLLQFIIGTWFMLSLPLPIFRSFVMGNFLNTVILCSGVLCGLISIVVFLLARNKYKQNGLIIFGSSFVLLTIILMVITRHNLRMEYLSIYFNTAREINIQSGPIILFFITLLSGVLAIAYMLKKTISAIRRK